MRLSKGGLTSAGIYTGFFLLALLEGFLTGPKGAGFFGQLAVFPGAILLLSLPEALGYGPEPFIPFDSWMNSLHFFYAVSLVVAYVFGWGIATVSATVSARVARGLNRIDERFLDRFYSDDR